ncbi:MAG: hypothetical protein Ta2D_07970 [Rickettsiales bacterium]|nr:MAG: hypothetical protein Ta2D_07970 [Rickettsiales bacterium]
MYKIGFLNGFNSIFNFFACKNNDETIFSQLSKKYNNVYNAMDESFFKRTLLFEKNELDELHKYMINNRV